MISCTAEYALRAMVFLAAAPETPRTVREIARGTKVPEGYLSKVMQSLSRAGLVRSQRGLHGGFRLGRDPGGLSILEVVSAVEAVARIRICPLGLPSHGAQLCALHRRLDAAAAMVERAFAESTLAELLADTASHPPLCEVARPAGAARAPAPRSARQAKARPRRPRG